MDKSIVPVEIDMTLDIENWFSYHAPTEDQIVAYGILRERAKAMAYSIFLHVPSCADRMVAFRKLRETVMAANQAIACNSE